MDNRSNILECALELFYQKGYDAVGIQEICQMAGVTKPTLYHYFGSKYGLLETLLKELFGDYIRQLEEAAAYQMSVEHSLNVFATELIDFANKNHRGYMLLMAMSYSAKESEAYRAVRPYITAIYNLAVSLFEQASYQLGNMNGRQEQFAIGFLGLINHYILFVGYRNAQGQEMTISEEKKYSLIHQFMHGIFS